MSLKMNLPRKQILIASLAFWFAINASAASTDEITPVDTIKFSGLSPEAAASEMTLPPSFHSTLFAGEPDVRQPIAFALDHRGRIWVAEAYTYPKRASEGE